MSHMTTSRIAAIASVTAVLSASGLFRPEDVQAQPPPQSFLASSAFDRLFGMFDTFQDDELFTESKWKQRLEAIGLSTSDNERTDTLGNTLSSFGLFSADYNVISASLYYRNPKVPPNPILEWFLTKAPRPDGTRLQVTTRYEHYTAKGRVRLRCDEVTLHASDGGLYRHSTTVASAKEGTNPIVVICDRGWPR
jgi:hypothetical protein